MVCDADVPGELGCSVIISEIDTGKVVFEDTDWTADELAGDALYDVDEPEQHSDDHGQRHVFGFSGAARHCWL